MDRNYSFFAIIPRYVSLSLSLRCREEEVVLQNRWTNNYRGNGRKNRRSRVNTVSRTCVRDEYTKGGHAMWVIGTGVSRLVWRSWARNTNAYVYIYIHRVRIMQASPLSTFRLRIWVGHELIVYNESALNRRVDAMRQRATLGVYRDFCNWNVFRTLMHASNPIGRSRLFLWLNQR